MRLWRWYRGLPMTRQFAVEWHVFVVFALAWTGFVLWWKL